jgi:hypothetical protein
VHAPDHDHEEVTLMALRIVDGHGDTRRRDCHTVSLGSEGHVCVLETTTPGLVQLTSIGPATTQSLVLEPTEARQLALALLDLARRAGQEAR